MPILYNVYTWGVPIGIRFYVRTAECDERISPLSNYSRMCGDLQRGAERKLKTRSRVRMNVSPPPALLFSVEVAMYS